MVRNWAGVVAGTSTTATPYFERFFEISISNVSPVSQEVTITGKVVPGSTSSTCATGVFKQRVGTLDYGAATWATHSANLSVPITMGPFTIAPGDSLTKGMSIGYFDVLTGPVAPPPSVPLMPSYACQTQFSIVFTVDVTEDRGAISASASMGFGLYGAGAQADYMLVAGQIVNANFQVEFNGGRPF